MHRKRPKSLRVALVSNVVLLIVIYTVSYNVSLVVINTVSNVLSLDVTSTDNNVLFLQFITISNHFTDFHSLCVDLLHDNQETSQYL